MSYYSLSLLTRLTNISQQETVHALSANAVLASANQTTIKPCQYNFPVTSFSDAIALAQTFTDVALGVLPAAQAQLAANGGQEAALIPVLGAIIGQEGQQDGWYRLLQKKVPSASPFLTAGAAPFAFSALSQFIVPGSCPTTNNVIGLTAFPPLTIESTPKAENSTLLFSMASNLTLSNATVSMAYISGQNKPVVVPLQGMVAIGGRNYFVTDFPFDSGFSRGLTIGALVRGNGAGLNTTAAVVAATIAGPALIEVS
jgi:hypothetical protein